MFNGWSEYFLFVNAIFLLFHIPFILKTYVAATICRTPFGAWGDQRALQDCKPMVDFLMRRGNMSNVEKKFLLESFVDYEQRIICCDQNFNHERAFRPVGAEILRNQANFCGDYTRPRISFGSESTCLAHPWSVLLIYNNELKFQCGGTLITNRYVLTAAHCIRQDLIGVRLGAHIIDVETDRELDKMGGEHCLQPALDVNIEKVIRHPWFSVASYDNDIALLRMDKPIIFINSMRPICIPEYQNQVFESQWGIISGWGATESSPFSSVHREAKIPIISRQSCQSVHRRRRIDNTKLCTRGVEGEDTCEGDSGGPLYVRVKRSAENGIRKFRYVQVGVTSLGYHICGTKMNIPGIYTNVASFVDWIAYSLEL